MDFTGMNNSDIQKKIDTAISESADLVTALEAVGAMYNIPSSNILCDNSLNTIKVVGENIVAPEKPNPTANAKAIMCSIGSVLDNISQRIDDKLNDFQLKNVSTGKDEEANGNTDSSPSKGTVVDTTTDANGDEVILYATGKYDTADTPEGKAAVEALQNKHCINTSSYFTEDDDLLNGVDTSSPAIETSDVAESINESADIISMMSKFGDTRSLGYDILTSHGFDYIKPTGEVYQEAVGEGKKSISPDDIKYFRFDNTNILKAIKYFNEARAEQKDAKRGELDIKKFIDSTNYKKAIQALNVQFDASINIRFFDTNQYNNLYTLIYDDIKKNLTISKSKGFQLNGLPVEIHVIDTAVDEDAPDDLSLFGQSIVAVFMHELFHNICGVLRSNEVAMNGILAVTIGVASSIRDGKKKRIFLSNYVNSLSDFCGIKLSKFKRKSLVKYLALISSINDDKTASVLKKQIADTMQSDVSDVVADKYIDDLISYYEKRLLALKGDSVVGKIKDGISIATMLVGASLAIAGIIKPELNTKNPGLAMFTISGISFGRKKIFNAALKSFRAAYTNSNEKEEFYCDMFAAMYKLPVTFFIPDKNFNRGKAVTPNKVALDKLNKLAMLEKQIGEYTFSTYPTLTERNFAAVTVAKNMLASGEVVDDSIKKYLEWIVENYSSTLDTDIKEIYSTVTFDPKTAEDLDKHLNNLIIDNNIVLTESAVMSRNKMTNKHDSCSEVFGRNDRKPKKKILNDEGKIVPDICDKCGSPVKLFLKGEPVYLCSNKKCNKYFGTAPCKS